MMALQNKNRKQGVRFSPSSRYSAAAEMDSSLHGHIEESSSGEVLYFISRFPMRIKRKILTAARRDYCAAAAA